MPTQQVSKDLLQSENQPSVPSIFFLNSRQADPAKSFQTERLQESAVVGRLKAFLPQLVSANQKLQDDIQSGGAEKFDIETIEDQSKPHIEMNLAVGIFNVKGKEEEAAGVEVSSDAVLRGTRTKRPRIELVASSATPAAPGAARPEHRAVEEQRAGGDGEEDDRQQDEGDDSEAESQDEENGEGKGNDAAEEHDDEVGWDDGDQEQDEAEEDNNEEQVQQR